MDIETAGVETPEAAVVTAIQAMVETSEATAEQSTSDTAPAVQEAGEDAPAAPKKKHWAHERIDELTRQRRDAERQAEYWREKATATTDLDTLEYDDQIAERVLNRNRREQAETAQESAASLADETFGVREEVARERFADYDAVAKNPAVRITPAMATVIKDSELGPDLAYHLGKNPTEAARIALLPVHRQAVELGKLEVRIGTPKPLPKQPPDPVQPVSGIKAGGSKDPATMSMAEFKAWREAKT